MSNYWESDSNVIGGGLGSSKEFYESFLQLFNKTMLILETR